MADSIVECLTLYVMKVHWQLNKNWDIAFMASVQLFNKDILRVLTSLDYRYLVVDPKQLIGYARKDKTPEHSLEVLGIIEYEIEKMKPSIIAVFEMYNLEVSAE